MRKIFAVISVFCMAGIVFAGTEVTGVVNTNVLNLRIQPTLQSPVAGKVTQGTKLVITGKKGSWLEVAAPETIKIYVSEAHISKGKTIIDLPMRSAMAGKAPSYGILPKGTAVKLLNERAYGWVRIAPPENLKVFTAAPYVTFDRDAVAKLAAKPAVKAETKPEAKKEAKAEVKAEAKPAVKAETKPEAKKAVAKPEAKPEAKAEAKKTAAKSEVKPEAKSEVKPAAKPEAKKTAAKPEAKKELKPISAADPRAKALKEYDIDVLKEKAQPVSLNGLLVETDSKNIATQYALGGADGSNQGFVCVAANVNVKKLISKQVRVTGRKFQVKNWTAPIIWVDEIALAK